jgi:hypothetical protein
MAAFTVIDHTEATGLTAYFEETGISGSYDHLYLVASLRSDDGATPLQNINLQLNGEGSNFYSQTNLSDGGGTPSSGRAGTGTGAWQQAFVDATVCGDTATADTFGALTCWIPHYANTSNFKQVIISTTAENATATGNQYRLRLLAGCFHSTSAITSVKLGPYAYANDWMEFSTFTLYGVTGA